MDVHQSLIWLAELQERVGILPGTERVRQALALWKHPQDRLRTVHVAGTNGKGSVCAMLQGVAVAAGYRVGVFSTPAPLSVLDTVTVNGTAIPEEAFAALCTEIRSLCEEHAIPLSEFEVNTVLAFLWFERQHCDLAIIECGMGGAEDATNVMVAPLVCVLTAVSLDHTAFLGNSVAEITRQKCGILRSGTPVVTVPEQDEEALEALFACGAERGVTVHLPGGVPAVIRSDLNGTAFRIGEKEYRLAMPGTFQVGNARAVLEVIRLLGEKGFHFTDENIFEGFRKASLPCRQEVVRTDPLRVIDGAHNRQGIAALVDTLQKESGSKPLIGLFGMLRDKDCSACVSLLAPLFREIVCCTPQNPRALPAEELAELFRKQGVSAVAIENPAEALCKAESLAGENPLIVGGSFYVAFPIRKILSKISF